MEKWEEKLPPRAREVLSKIEITREDRERIKGLEKIKSLLSDFYQDKLTPEDFARGLKEYELKKREFLIKEAQLKLIDSLSLQILSSDFVRRGKCILVLERLKSHNKHGQIKMEINLLGGLIKKYREEKNKFYNQLKRQVEANPKLRIRQVSTDEGQVVIQLSPDEAVLSSSQWKDFISQHDSVYRSQFASSVGRLKGFA
ncbi:hypothetical protein IBX65_05330 [Candidatus Aerophobetes bacterium]|nr:hypothetical protein [Candidatus Aerophobetes bacterium]